MYQDTFDEAIHAVLTEREVRELVRLSKVTLLRMRQQKDQGGLPFIQLSPGRIGYRKSDIEAFLLARRVGHLPDEVPAAAQDLAVPHQPVLRRPKKVHAYRSPSLQR